MKAILLIEVLNSEPWLDWLFGNEQHYCKHPDLQGGDCVVNEEVVPGGEHWEDLYCPHCGWSDTRIHTEETTVNSPRENLLHQMADTYIQTLVEEHAIDYDRDDADDVERDSLNVASRFLALMTDQEVEQWLAQIEQGRSLEWRIPQFETEYTFGIWGF